MIGNGKKVNATKGGMPNAKMGAEAERIHGGKGKGAKPPKHARSAKAVYNNMGGFVCATSHNYGSHHGRKGSHLKGAALPIDGGVSAAQEIDQQDAF